jgi:hypothetical protein
MIMIHQDCGAATTYLVCLRTPDMANDPEFNAETQRRRDAKKREILPLFCVLASWRLGVEGQVMSGIDTGRFAPYFAPRLSAFICSPRDTPKGPCGVIFFVESRPCALASLRLCVKRNRQP